MARRARLASASFVFASCTTIASPSRPAAAQESLEERLPVQEVTLDNGLRLLMLPRPGAPTVSFVMQFGVGGVHEARGKTGIAHLLEHMLFKGTESIGTRNLEAEQALFLRIDAVHDRLVSARDGGDPVLIAQIERELAGLEDEARTHVVSNEYDRMLTRAGAQGLNATTNNESTTYFVELPANRTELFFALEADRMSRPVFREFYSERDVVIEERRMRVETSPAGALYEAHLGAAFAEHPYGVPVVGYLADLQRLSRSDAERYYRTYYGPDNAVLAVVGRFDPEQVEGWARRYLGPLTRGQEPEPIGAVEPQQQAERRVAVEWDAEPLLRIGWHVPSSRHPDAPALAVLSSLLTGGRTARLHRRLVTEERIATSIYSSMGPGSLYPQLFQIEVTPIQPATTAELEREIYRELDAMARTGPTAEELDRVLNRIASGGVRRLQSNLGLAFQIAGSESLFRDWRETFRSSERLQEVTPEDVREVARRYFGAENRTVATLVRAGDR